MRRTIGKFPLGIKGKIDHNICGFEDQVRGGDCEKELGYNKTRLLVTWNTTRIVVGL
jgi:hypothetical protein